MVTACSVSLSVYNVNPSGLTGRKKEQIALYLLEKGANPNMRNGKQRNPVHLAAYGNMPEAIKMLIQRGADVNAKVSRCVK